jgi:hypothetical protein
VPWRDLNEDIPSDCNRGGVLGGERLRSHGGWPQGQHEDAEDDRAGAEGRQREGTESHHVHLVDHFDQVGQGGGCGAESRDGKRFDRYIDDD